ncbi:polysaccharide biosynthesis tyrosine autokinase [Massilistercora timonensis]|uniref:polysaccharide biosynthesis tyrosine autokinase n=1 Tax=Massilistercora timonensis TaxID=2086584 RepID=UPI00320AC335
MKEIEILQNEYTYAMREELKTLRTNLQFCGDDKRVILITSSAAGEGKSATSLNLAVSLTELGKKVILVDADIRKSVMVSRLQKGTVNYGLAHFLAGQCQVSEAVCAVRNVEGLHMMFSGPSVPNPTELLSSSRFEKMILAFRKVYDYIIIDGPPLGLVVDSAIIAKSCDGAAIVVAAGMVKYRFVQTVKEKILNAGCPVLGVILNKVDRDGGGKYYRKHYGKYYGEYYGKG